MLVCANSNQPWNSTLPTLILFPNCKTLTDIKQIHARLLTTGYIKNNSLITKLILNFSSSPYTPLIQFARYIFFSQYSIQNPRRKQEDPFLWNSIIKTFSHGDDDPKQAVFVLSLMLENGVRVDKFSLSLVLKACSRLDLIKEGMQIHGLMRKFGIGIGDNVFLQNCLICMYVRCGCVEFARQVFDRMPERDSVSFNSMIDGYVKTWRIGLARELFDSMPLGMKNLITWNSMICGYAQSLDGFKVAWELFEEMPERDLVSWNLIIDCYAKCGKMETARALFDKMPKRDVVSWANMIYGYAKLGSVDIARGFFDNMPERDVISCNVMMAGYAQNGHYSEAIDIFHDILSDKHLCPDSITLLIALSAIAKLGNIDEGVEVHFFIEESGLIVDGKVGVALIDMYAKCGSIENALWVFEGIENKNVDHWNAMISGLAVHGLGELAFDLFMEMERLSVKPDDITFIGVLNACSHSGLVKEGLLCFEIMRRVHKLEPKLQHYGCMVDILGRAGHIEAAIRFIEKMPIVPNVVVWQTLLSACKNHENLSIGELVAKYLMEMDCCNSSTYVLLSNIYAQFGMWECVRRIRTMMEVREIKKIPGSSWIEVEGDVHEFFSGDKFHPQVKEIYSTLDKWWALKPEVTLL
ncbi:hypothetical protein LguiB_010958 [Lonicera macranthoides]